jgi:predicted nucleic acid-binding protein
MKAVFDTNILIDYLNGHDLAATTLEKYRDRLISRISWMEVLVGAENADEDIEIRDFLSLFTLVEAGSEVSELAVELRREHKLRLPDAIVLASAHHEGCLLITRNTRDFRRDWVEVHVPYEL